MKRFDINACFGHWQYWDLQDKTAADLVALMDRNGIEQAAASSLRGILVDWRRGNDETLAAAGRHAPRLVPLATLSPFLGGDGKELEKLVQTGMRGVRLYPAFHNYPLDDPFVDEICQTAAACRVPVMLPTRPMMNWRFTPVPIETIGRVVERHAGTTFIISGPNYLVEFQAVVRLMTRCPNLALDISCVQGFDAVGRLVRQVGAERLLFGTGAVLQYPACNVAKLDHASISADQRHAIGSANARRLLGLEP